MPSPKPPFLLSPAQVRRLSPHFPLPHGIPRVDDRRVLSGIIYVIRHGLQWRDAPTAYGPHKTLYNRFIRWSRMGVFDRIFAALAAEGGPPERIMIDSTHLKAHRTAASLLKKGLFPLHRKDQRRAELQAPRCLRRSGPSRRAAAHRRPSQRPQRRGADAAQAAASPRVDCRPRLRQCRFRAELDGRGVAACIPSTRSRKRPIPHDATLYRQRYRIEIMFGRLKDWRRIAMRYDRCAHTFFSAITLAATVTFWLDQ